MVITSSNPSMWLWNLQSEKSCISSATIHYVVFNPYGAMYHMGEILCVWGQIWPKTPGPFGVNSVPVLWYHIILYATFGQKSTPQIIPKSYRAVWETTKSHKHCSLTPPSGAISYIMQVKYCAFEGQCDPKPLPFWGKNMPCAYKKLRLPYPQTVQW